LTPTARNRAIISGNGLLSNFLAELWRNSVAGFCQRDLVAPDSSTPHDIFRHTFTTFIHILVTLVAAGSGSTAGPGGTRHSEVGDLRQLPRAACNAKVCDSTTRRAEWRTLPGYGRGLRIPRDITGCTVHKTGMRFGREPVRRPFRHSPGAPMASPQCLHPVMIDPIYTEVLAPPLTPTALENLPRIAPLKILLKIGLFDLHLSH
jgi:hypothetical protein